MIEGLIVKYEQIQQIFPSITTMSLICSLPETDIIITFYLQKLNTNNSFPSQLKF